VRSLSKQILSYDPNLKELAKQLRKNSTLSEVLLWQQLKGKQMKGYDFHRQKPIQHYIVDFFCHELMLAIEIDGITHNEKIAYDMQRQKQIELLGIQFLRFTDEDIKGNLAGVLETIQMWIDEQHVSALGGTHF
jgi:very-short-patch-repair endonuclease